MMATVLGCWITWLYTVCKWPVTVLGCWVTWLYTVCKWPVTVLGWWITWLHTVCTWPVTQYWVAGLHDYTLSVNDLSQYWVAGWHCIMHKTYWTEPRPVYGHRFFSGGEALRQFSWGRQCKPCILCLKDGLIESPHWAKSGRKGSKHGLKRASQRVGKNKNRVGLRECDGDQKVRSPWLLFSNSSQFISGVVVSEEVCVYIGALCLSTISEWEGQRENYFLIIMYIHKET